MRYHLLLCAACLTALTACGDQRPDADAGEPSRESFDVSPADEAQAQREAQAVRERCQSDGKGRYTPQPVDGF
ncbi:hypothetical protein [Alcaligenes faecalis]|uniref:hypothetical protein n=1 Tax=Alcaligenes faecalis TaxID=511 RepID=UPI00122C8115|nr:hypothetical protein [Alcaligenes faecalis]KAA1288952.1 hypothetical protein D7S43_02695 [Alcaligenes faecalis]MCR4142896.1 hypothetical protein [Alcaligenes faecalis]WHQ43798.1 hypothetical protein E8D21_09440 [Alcaligenes faecalis]